MPTTRRRKKPARYTEWVLAVCTIDKSKSSTSGGGGRRRGLGRSQEGLEGVRRS